MKQLTKARYKKAIKRQCYQTCCGDCQINPRKGEIRTCDTYEMTDKELITAYRLVYGHKEKA